MKQKKAMMELTENLAVLKEQLAGISDSGINKKEYLDLVRKILLTPGDLWSEAMPEDKIKLQWFYFPHGIQVDKSISRTPKICSLFKIKSIFSDINSSKVDVGVQFWNRFAVECQYLVHVMREYERDKAS